MLKRLEREQKCFVGGINFVRALTPKRNVFCLLRAHPGYAYDQLCQFDYTVCRLQIEFQSRFVSTVYRPI